MTIRSDNSVPGNNGRPQNFCIDKPFNFGSDSLINIRSSVTAPIPPYDAGFIYQDDNIMVTQDDNTLQPQTG